MTRTPNSFLLVKGSTDTKNYVVHIDELRLVIRHIGLKPSYIEYVNKQLEMGKRGELNVQISKRSMHLNFTFK